MNEVAPDNWQDAVTRRLPTLVRLGPLHRIEAVKVHRDNDLADIDLRAMCLRALDLTIERMASAPMTHEGSMRWKPRSSRSVSTSGRSSNSR